MQSRPAERERDLEFLVRLRNEEVCVRYSSRGVLTQEQVEIDYFDTPGKHAYVVEDPKPEERVGGFTSTQIGYLICNRLDEDTYQISVALDPSRRGMGYGGQMMYEAARLCIDRHGAKRVVADVHADNTPSIRSMEKVGFRITQREGTLWEMAYSDNPQEL